MIWTSAEKTILPITFLIVVILTLVLYFIFRNKSDKIKRIPFIIIASVLLILEIVKIGLSLPNISSWSLPLHFCSTFLIWFSLAAFSRGKIAQTGYVMSVLCGCLFLIFFYIDPGSIIGNSAAGVFSSFGSFHTFFYHHNIILFTLLAILLKQFKPEFSQIKFVAICFSIYAVLAIAMAHILQTNYANLLYSSIGFMQKLLDLAGIVIYTIVMYLFGLAALFVELIMGIYISKLFNKKIKKI